MVTPILQRHDGQGRVNVELAGALLARGHHLLLIAFAIDADLLAHVRVRWIAVPRGRIPTYLLREAWFAAASTVILAWQRARLDLIVVNGFSTWWRSDINLVHFVHHAWLHSPFHPYRHEPGIKGWLRWLYTALNVGFERASFRSARAVIAVSPLVRRQLLSCSVCPDRIHVVPNGVDLAAFAPGPGDRSRFALPPCAFMALFAGDIRSARKNLDTVLAALVRLPDIHLAVAGNAAGSPYPQRARTMGIAGRVHFVGLRHDIAELMRAADVFVFPSRFEPFGLVLLEASASGLPAIASPEVGACEALHEGGLFVLDHCGDVDGIVDALRRLSGDPALHARMARSARTGATLLSWEHTTARYVQIIEGYRRLETVGH